ncbi:D-alanyl-D-alanine dipeptidase [Sulfitobacter marinus]|uniref:D-alanyl-D-alanine dipeptidase n=1 Tax=Sulfitobacter marinus TaxID=394264 RepID=A0A1I6RD95_9RHOB|nr:D-alanyl-D-alanine dipeptidase [Sulfitobacter marinus]
MITWDSAKQIAAGTSEEPLVSAADSKHWICKPVYFQNGFVGALPQIWLRQSVLDRLKIASEVLPNGYRLVLLDGWRPKQLQQALFDDMRQKIATENPRLEGIQLDEMTMNYCSKVSDDPVQPSPHLTGGAVDVTLANASGVELDMGSAFDEPSQRSWTTYQLSGAPMHHRKVLHSAMIQSGFTNLPSEWWHYDYGNWVWAWYSEASVAEYGPIEHI